MTRILKITIFLKIMPLIQILILAKEEIVAQKILENIGGLD